jgi:hypothetical protein
VPERLNGHDWKSCSGGDLARGFESPSLRCTMAITKEEIDREKQRLPRGWGRFGKTLDKLAELSQPEESLVSTCVALNPKFEHRTVTLVGGLLEMTKTTNIVLAATSERLLMVGTGFGGAPRADTSIPYDGLEIVSRGDSDFVLAWPDAQMRVKGSHKKQTPEFLDALAARARPTVGGEAP